MALNVMFLQHSAEGTVSVDVGTVSGHFPNSKNDSTRVQIERQQGGRGWMTVKGLTIRDGLVSGSGGENDAPVNLAVFTDKTFG